MEISLSTFIFATCTTARIKPRIRLTRNARTVNGIVTFIPGISILTNDVVNILINIHNYNVDINYI